MTDSGGEGGGAPIDAVARVPTPFWTQTFAAMSLVFCVESTDESIRDLFDDLCVGLRIDDRAPMCRYRLIGLSRGGHRNYYAFVDGDYLVSSRRPGYVFSFILWHANHTAVTTNADVVVIHAAAAEREGRAILLPGPAGSGKTTLVAGLVQRGLRYLTDEAVGLAVDDERRVFAYPKPLTIEIGSRDALAALRPARQREILGRDDQQWHVPPAAIRDGAVASHGVPALLVVPRYDPSRPTMLAPLARSRALKLLVDEAFNLSRFGRAGFERLGQLVRDCDCYTLVMADLDQACRLVLELVSF